MSASPAAAPSVSVLLAVRNEDAFIEACLQSLLDQRELPSRYEILVIDGMSDDGTRERVRSLAACDSRVRLLDNPRGIVPTALNIGIRNSESEVLIRVDGHTRVADDFIHANLQLLHEHPEAWVVGGPIAHRGQTLFGRGVAAAMSSAVGVGGASHRFEHYEGYAESVAFPAFRRWVFDRVGMFDEDLVRNQDDEFNFRITEAGGKIFISPRVRYDYYVRGSAGQLYRQYLQYAFWKVSVIRKHGKIASLRHLVPAGFVLGLPLCLAGAALLPASWSLVCLLPPALYVALLCWLAVAVLRRERNLWVAVSAAAAASIMHVAYGVGMIRGFFSRGRGAGVMQTLSR